eukprot:Skav219967  [mRNA]  locus=scaffold2879:331655:341537:+ [translate_table: standard]
MILTKERLPGVSDAEYQKMLEAGKFDVVFDNNVRKLEEIQPVVQGIKAGTVALFTGGLLLRPLNYNPVERYFFDRVTRGRPVCVPYGGKYITQLGHCEDLADFMAKCVGNGEYVTFDGMAKVCAEAAGIADPQIVHYDPKTVEVYKGQWELGVRSGHGEWRHPKKGSYVNGAEYEGQWKEGRFHDDGELRLADGTSYASRQGKPSPQGGHVAQRPGAWPGKAAASSDLVQWSPPGTPRGPRGSGWEDLR